MEDYIKLFYAILVQVRAMQNSRFWAIWFLVMLFALPSIIIAIGTVMTMMK